MVKAHQTQLGYHLGTSLINALNITVLTPGTIVKAIVVCSRVTYHPTETAENYISPRIDYMIGWPCLHGSPKPIIRIQCSKKIRLATMVSSRPENRISKYVTTIALGLLSSHVVSVGISVFEPRDEMLAVRFQDTCIVSRRKANYISHSVDYSLLRPERFQYGRERTRHFHARELVGC